MSDEQATGRHIALATVSFAVCFMAWGLVSAFAAWFRERFALTATETALLIAVPVLLGAVARLPMGLLSDRFGGRRAQVEHALLHMLKKPHHPRRLLIEEVR